MGKTQKSYGKIPLKKGILILATEETEKVISFDISLVKRALDWLDNVEGYSHSLYETQAEIISKACKYNFCDGIYSARNDKT
jgi:hypothetical protein